MEVGLRLVAECRSVIGAHSPKCRGASLALRAVFAPPGASSRSSRAAQRQRASAVARGFCGRNVCCLRPRAGCRGACFRRRPRPAPLPAWPARRAAGACCARPRGQHACAVTQTDAGGRASRCCEKPPQRALTPRGGAGASLDEQTWQRHRRAGRVRAGALAGDTRAVPGASCVSQPALFLRTAADAASPAQPVAKGCRRAGRNVTTA